MANNTIYCPSGNCKIYGLRGVVVTGNVFAPSPRHVPRKGNIKGRTVELDFVDARRRNVYPRADSKLIGAADPHYVVVHDFDGNVRAGRFDAGAYARTSDDEQQRTIIKGLKKQFMALPHGCRKAKIGRSGA